MMLFGVVLGKHMVMLQEQITTLSAQLRKEADRSLSLSGELFQRANDIHQLKQENEQLKADLSNPNFPPKHARRLIAQLRNENADLRKDADRLDRLEIECEAYGTDIHEGNRWAVDGPFATVRDAIDAAMGKGDQP